MNISKAIRLALVPLCASMSALAGNAPTTPITNVIVLFQENVSFDHYFGTYPNAQNNAGEQKFVAYPGTPTVNGLTPDLLNSNPNTNNPATGSGITAGRVNPPRLSPAQAYTCSQNHNYGPEQQAVDSGLMDKFPLYTGRNTSEGCAADGSTVLGYFDGNTVAAMWNYAQNYAMSDNSFGSTFGPSTPGAINLVSGKTYNGITHFGTGSTSSYPNAVSQSPSSAALTATGAPVTDIGDFDPYLDDCGNDAGGTVHTTTTLEMNSDPTAATGNKNIGNLLNAAGVTWGWFAGGFLATTPYNAATGAPAICGKGRTLHMYPSNAAYVAPNSSSTPGAVVVPNPVAPFVTGADIHNPTYGADAGPRTSHRRAASTRSPVTPATTMSRIMSRSSSTPRRAIRIIAAELGGGDRHDRPGEPSVRLENFFQALATRAISRRSPSSRRRMPTTGTRATRIRPRAVLDHPGRSTSHAVPHWASTAHHHCL